MSAPSPSRIVLACLLSHPEWLAPARVALGQLSDAAFSGDKFERELWSALYAFHERDIEPTPIDVLAAVAKAEHADSLAEVRQLMELAAVETRASFDRRIVELHDSTYQRVARSGLQRMLVKSEADPAFDWLASLEGAQRHLLKRKRSDRRYVPLTPDRVRASTARRKRLIPSGFADIDAAVGGFLIGRVLLVGARTNVGKSSFMAAVARNQLCSNAAKNIERLQEAKLPEIERFRATLSHAQPANPQDKVQAPYVLLLSVEDETDDYISRPLVDLCNVDGQEYLANPQRAIGPDKQEQLDRVAEALGSGRLTIADYEHEDGNDAKTLANIIETINGWARLTRAQAAEQGITDPPLLVLLDYFQKVNSPEDEKVLKDERRVLAAISSKLHRLAKSRKIALVMTIMLLRDHDHIEPDGNKARGGSDAPQDCDAMWVLWPFGAAERREIERATMQPPDTTPFDADNDPGESFALDEELDPAVARRAAGELIVTCDKNRHGPAGWRVPLHFDRRHKRITDAYDDKLWRFDDTISRIVAQAREHKSKK